MEQASCVDARHPLCESRRGVAKQIAAARLRWLRARAHSEQLKQVVGQADQRSLRSDLVVATEGEAPKGVDLPSFGRAQLLAHPLRDRAPQSRGRRLGAPMRVPVRMGVTVDALERPKRSDSLR